MNQITLPSASPYFTYYPSLSLWINKIFWRQRVRSRSRELSSSASGYTVSCVGKREWRRCKKTQYLYVAVLHGQLLQTQDLGVQNGVAPSQHRGNTLHWKTWVSFLKFPSPLSFLMHLSITAGRAVQGLWSANVLLLGPWILVRVVHEVPQKTQRKVRRKVATC